VILPESPLLAEMFVDEARRLMDRENATLDEVMNAAEKLAAAAAYAGRAPDIKLVGKILRAKARLSEAIGAL
jgi:hypothetical protein